VSDEQLASKLYSIEAGANEEHIVEMKNKISKFLSDVNALMNEFEQDGVKRSIEFTDHVRNVLQEFIVDCYAKGNKND